MLLNLFVQQVSINLRTHWHKGLTETSWESWGWLLNSLLSTCDFWSVSWVEMINGLFRGKFWNWWQHWKSITSQKNNILRVTSDGWDLGVVDELQWVTGSGILSDWCIKIINFTGNWIQCHVFKNCTELDGVVDFWLLFSAEIYTFGITSSLNVENTLFSPNMLIITDKFSIANGTQSSFSSAWQTEEEANVTALANVATWVQW